MYWVPQSSADIKGLSMKKILFRDVLRLFNKFFWPSRRRGQKKLLKSRKTSRKSIFYAKTFECPRVIRGPNTLNILCHIFKHTKISNMEMQSNQFVISLFLIKNAYQIILKTFISLSKRWYVR